MNFYNDKKFFLVEKFFETEDLTDETKRIINKAIVNKWKFIKVFYNIFIYKSINIFAINYPFNKFFNSKLLFHIKKTNLKKKVLDLTGWDDLETIATELQYNYKYNYQSTWHRDSDFPSDEVTVIIFLEDEKGFRIVPKSMNEKLKYYSIDIRKKKYLKKDGYLNLSKEFFEIIDAKKGDFIILDSGLLHQGFSKGNRNHILMRFKKKIKTSDEIDFYNKYNLREELEENTEIKRLNELSKIKESYNFENNYFSIFNKFKSFFYYILYYLPFHRTFKFIGDRKKRRTYFHYTHYQ